MQDTSLKQTLDAMVAQLAAKLQQSRAIDQKQDKREFTLKIMHIYAGRVIGGFAPRSPEEADNIVITQFEKTISDYWEDHMQPRVDMLCALANQELEKLSEPEKRSFYRKQQERQLTTKIKDYVDQRLGEIFKENEAAADAGEEDAHYYMRTVAIKSGRLHAKHWNKGLAIPVAENPYIHAPGAPLPESYSGRVTRIENPEIHKLGVRIKILDITEDDRAIRRR